MLDSYSFRLRNGGSVEMTRTATGYDVRVEGEDGLPLVIAALSTLHAQMLVHELQATEPEPEPASVPRKRTAKKVTR